MNTISIQLSLALQTFELLTRRTQLILLILFCPACLIAQKDSIEYVKSFSKTNFVQPYIGSFMRSLQFISKEKSGSMYNMKLSPNAALFTGVSLRYKKLNIYAEATIPKTSKVHNRNTDVKAYSIFVHHFLQNWGITGFISWNKGLLMKVPFPSMYAERNDLRMITLGAHIYSIFNGKKFSYTAANSMAKLQTKSKGSLIIMTTPSFRKLSTQIGIIPDSLREYHFNGSSAPSRSLQFISLQCRPGYIYNIIFKEKKYFLAPAVYVGAGADLHTFKTDRKQHTDLNFSTGYRMKIITGVNSERYYWSLEYLLDNTTTYLNKTTIKNTYTEVSFNLGFRF